MLLLQEDYIFLETFRSAKTLEMENSMSDVLQKKLILKP